LPDPRPTPIKIGLTPAPGSPTRDYGAAIASQGVGQGSPIREQHLEQHWLTVGDAARVLGVSPQTVRNRIAAGELEARKGNRGPLQVLVTAGPDLGDELAKAREEVAQLEVKLAEATSRLTLADQRSAMLEGERDRLAALLERSLGPPTVISTVRRWVVRLLEPRAD
jgi:hypothetical protein